MFSILIQNFGHSFPVASEIRRAFWFNAAILFPKKKIPSLLSFWKAIQMKIFPKTGRNCFLIVSDCQILHPAFSCWFCIDLTYGNVAGCAFQQTRAIFIKFKTCQCIGRFIAGRDSWRNWLSVWVFLSYCNPSSQNRFYPPASLCLQSIPCTAYPLYSCKWHPAQ